MSILTHIITTSGNNTERKHLSILTGFSSLLHKTSELFWFLTSFILFLLLGPFSAIAVIPAILSLGSEKNRINMKEPESC